MAQMLERSVRGSVGLGWAASLVAALLLLGGCAENGSTAPAPVVCKAVEVATPEGICRPEDPKGCPPGEMLLESGECQPAGLPPDMLCPPGEWPSEDGICQAAGVRPEACAEGFQPDGNGGCNAILPEEPCPPGQMAVPGETSCREVAPCGDGPWGTIPLEANTQFVDQAYAGGDSDGTIARPWTTVQQGVDAAAGGAIVAVTDGVYEEDVRIEGKAVRLWGRCPGLVEVRGTGGQFAAIEILRDDADGSESRGLAVTGVGSGIDVVGASDVRIEQVWLHDTEGWGIDIEDAYGPTSVTVQGSLVEQNHGSGVFVSGSDAELEETVVRATQSVNGQGGWGITIRISAARGERANVGIRGCLVEQNHELGVAVSGSDAELEATVVRATQPVNGQLGRGIGIQVDPDTGERANVDIRGCVVEQNHEVGVFVLGSDAKLEATVVRATQSVNGQGGWGISIQVEPNTGERANVGIRGCLVEQNHDLGVFVLGSDAKLEATVVHATQPVNGRRGRGIGTRADPDTGERANVGIRGCVVEQNHDLGVFVAGSDAELEATVVRATQPVSGQSGRGIVIQDEPDAGERANVGIRACVVEQNHELGVFISGSDAQLEATVVRATQPVNGQLGRGIGIQVDLDAGERANVGIRACVVEQNHEIGIAIVRSDAAIDATTVRDTAANADGSFGDGIVVEYGKATIQSTTVSGSARAGVANFGSDVMILSSTLTCNTLDLNGETHGGIHASFDGSADWQCSRVGAEDCMETDTCPVMSASLEPPPPLEPAPQP